MHFEGIRKAYTPYKRLKFFNINIEKISIAKSLKRHTALKVFRHE
jgi:hypothetical protein